MVYIGQTGQDLHTRWLQHCSSKYCRRLHYAINKYGRESFKIEEIDSANSLEELNQLEVYHIKKENCLSPNGYNLLTGGGSFRHHEETKKKMSKSRTGKSVPLLQLPRGSYSKEHCENISKAKKGNNGLSGKTNMPYHPVPSRWKPVVAKDKVSGEIRNFKSVKEASEFFKVSHANIVACLNGRRKHSAKQSWKYKHQQLKELTMSNESTTKVFVSTTMVLLSKKLFQDYKHGRDIIVSGFKINSLLRLTNVRESNVLDEDVLVCFDDDLNSVGIIKVGIFGYVMPIVDKHSTFINLYKPMPISEPEEKTYKPNYGFPSVAIMHRIAI